MKNVVHFSIHSQIGNHEDDLVAADADLATSALETTFTSGADSPALDLWDDRTTPTNQPDTAFLASKLNQIQDGRTGLLQGGVSEREIDVMSLLLNNTGNATYVAEAYQSGFVTEFSIRDRDQDKVLSYPSGESD